MNLIRQFGIYSVIGTIALMSLLILPAMIGMLVDETTLTESQAGLSASIYFMGGAVVAILMALRMHRLDLRRVATIALVLAALGDFASGFIANQTASFMVVRFIAGVGTWAAYTATLGAFARLPDVDRGYAMFVTLQFSISGLGLYLLPVYSSVLGVSGIFMVLATLDLTGAWLSSCLPGRAIDGDSEPRGQNEIHVLLAGATILGTLGFAIFEAANTAQFTYVERLGVALEFTDQQVGTALLIASLVGIPGAFSIMFLGDRLGRVAPLSFGIMVGVGGLFVLMESNQFNLYLLGLSMISFSWAFCLPYIQGLLASLDRNGSAVAAGSATATIGGAIGPGVAALVVGGGNYTGVFMFSSALLLVALMSLIGASRYMHKPIGVS